MLRRIPVLIFMLMAASVAEAQALKLGYVDDGAIGCGCSVSHNLTDSQNRLDYVVTKVCDPNDEGCEATYYRANMTVTRGKQKLVVKGIAICGC